MRGAELEAGWCQQAHDLAESTAVIGISGRGVGFGYNARDKSSVLYFIPHLEGEKQFLEFVLVEL